jgi:selenium metabolism protein YedF
MLKGGFHMKEIDCRGLACPAPVIATKKALEEASDSPLRVLLDKGAARENVLRFCASKGFDVSEELGEDSTSLLISSILKTTPQDNRDEKESSPVLLICSDRLGSGSDELGRLLMKNFIITLLELSKKPEKIFFVNSGVLLTTEGSELIEPLSKLAYSGVEIFSCGVCLDYYVVADKLVVGKTSNMYTIAESILISGHAIKL